MAAPEPLYDLMLLLDSAAPDEQRTKILGDVRDAIARDGEIVGEHEWGMRAMAYEIRHKTDAEYHLLQFHGPAAVIDALNRTLRITDGVTRHRVIKLAPGTPPAPDVRQEAPAPRADDAPADEPAEPVESAPAS